MTPSRRPRDKVLVVDASSELRELYAVALEEAGYEVRTASDAEEALASVRDWRPDVVVTDVFMPGLSGLELVTRVRAEIGRAKPRLVVISGFEEVRDEVLRRGADRFVPKPVSHQDLLQIVAEALTPELAPVRLGDARARRAAARSAGEAELAKFLAEEPDVFAIFHEQAAMLARFVGHETLFLVLRNGKLEVVASGLGAFAIGTEAAAVLPLLEDVVETRSSLVLAGPSMQPFLEKSGLGFAVAVPVVIDDVTVGAICLVDRSEEPFDRAELDILEFFARHCSARIRGAPRIVDDSGLLGRRAFEAVLGASIRAAHDHDCALGLTLLEVGALPRDRSLASATLALKVPHLLAGAINGRHVALLAYAESADLVRRKLLLVRTELDRMLTTHAAAELTWDPPVPKMDARSALESATELLQRAVVEGGDRSERFIAVDTRRRTRRSHNGSGAPGQK